MGILDDITTETKKASRSAEEIRRETGAVNFKVNDGEAPMRVGGAAGWYAGDNVTHWESDGFSDTANPTAKAMAPEEVDAALTAAGVDWKAHLIPARYFWNGEDIESEARKFIVRGPRESYVRQGKPDPKAGIELGIIGGSKRSKWQALQPDSPARLIAAAGCHIARIGEISKGRKVFAQSPQGEIAVPGGDKAKVSLFAIENLTGSGSFECVASGVIAACQNFIRSLIRIARKGGLSVKIAHNAKAEEKLATLTAALKALREAGEEFSAEAFEMAATKLKDGDLEAVEAKLFGDPKDRSKRAEGNVARFRQSYTLGEIADETMRRTVWGVYMGATHYATHNLKTKQGTDPAQAWLDSQGSRAKFERQASEVVEELLAGTLS